MNEQRDSDKLASPFRHTVAQFIWHNGHVIPFEEAKIHVLSPAARYGITAIEGLRAYWGGGRENLFGFRFADHFRRISQTTKLMRIQLPYTYEEFIAAVREAVAANEFREDVHIRQYVYVGGTGGYYAVEPVGAFIAPYPLARLYDIDKGIKCRVSSWRRIDDQVLPPRVKMGSNYANSRLAKIEALLDGYDTSILLDQMGKVTEGSAETLFLMRDDCLITPPVTAGVLEGITRRTVIELARRELSLNVTEREVDRTELYVADEVFLCGSGTEIVPVVSIDHFSIGGGEPGEITQSIQKAYFSIARGEEPSYYHWLTPLYEEK
jgi:branched-chain amino acid aminotransferase